MCHPRTREVAAVDVVVVAYDLPPANVWAVVPLNRFGQTHEEVGVLAVSLSVDGGAAKGVEGTGKVAFAVLTRGRDGNLLTAQALQGPEFGVDARFGFVDVE